VRGDKEGETPKNDKVKNEVAVALKLFLKYFVLWKVLSGKRIQG